MTTPEKCATCRGKGFVNGYPYPCGGCAGSGFARPAPLPASSEPPDLTIVSDRRLAEARDNTLADLALAEKYPHNAHLIPAITAMLDRLVAEQKRRAASSEGAQPMVKGMGENECYCSDDGTWFCHHHAHLAAPVTTTQDDTPQIVEDCGDQDVTICRHRLTRSADGRWDSCDICKADFPADRPETRPSPTTEGEPLKPCPFCGAGNPAIHPNGIAKMGCEMGVPNTDVFYVHCNECGAEGPQSDSEPESIAAWNRRADSLVSSLGVENARLRKLEAIVSIERGIDGGWNAGGLLAVGQGLIERAAEIARLRETITSLCATDLALAERLIATARTPNGRQEP